MVPAHGLSPGTRSGTISRFRPSRRMLYADFSSDTGPRPVRRASPGWHCTGSCGRPAKLHVKEQARWADAVKPLPAVLNRLEKHALTVTILLFAFLALKAIVMSRGDIPTALGIFQTTSPAVTVIGALLSALPLAAVAVLVVIGYRAAKEASSEGYALAVAAALVCFFVTPWPVLIVLYRDSQVGKRVPCQLRPRGLLSNMTTWQALAPRAWAASSEPDCPPGFRGSP
jgi:hypothetical protein